MINDTQRRIMKAAKDLAEENRSVHGVTISLDSVAKRAGLTKPGLMYHFQTKEALMVGLVEHVASEWAERLRLASGREAEVMSAFDRYRTYIETTMDSDASRAEYWIFSAAAYQPALSETWLAHFRPWFDTSGLSSQSESLLTTARFVSEGAWTAQATGVFPAADNKAVRLLALRLVDEAEAFS